MWTRESKIGFASLIVALLSCIVAVALPEVRRLLGFDTPSAVSSASLVNDAPVQFAAPVSPRIEETPTSIPTTRAPAASKPAGPSEVVASLPPGQPLRVESARASSVLPASRVARYDAEMLLDGDGSTPWVEDAPGYGIGEWVELELGQTRNIVQLRFRNGYDKGARFGENGRVRSITATFSSGEAHTFSLADHASEQTISFDPLPAPASSIRLTINSVYEGSRWDDTALGDVVAIGY